MRSSSSLLWAGVGIVSALTVLFMMSGFVYAVKTVVLPAVPAHDDGLPQERVPDSQPGVTIVTLGDSLTKGAGDASGRGYAGMVRQRLAERSDEPVYFIPFAINGYHTDELLQAIREQSGIIAALRQADIVLFTIGGNDLFTLGEEVDVDKARELMSGALERLEAIFSELDAINPQARVYYSALYNPFKELDPDGEASLFVQQFNYEVFRLSLPYDSITVVPTFDLFEPDPSPYLASDRFHPNEAGYARIAERIFAMLPHAEDD